MSESRASVATGAWGERALDVARACAIFTAVTAPISTAAGSIGSAVFLFALLVSGRIHRVVADAWRMPAGKAMAAFLVWVLVSSSWSAVGVEAALRDFWAWRKLVYFYVALPLFTGSVWKHRAVAALFYVSAVAVILSFASIALHTQFRHWDEGVMGVVLTNHAVQGAVFAVAAAAGAYLATQASGAARWAYGFVSIALIINVLFFGTGRTGYLAIVGVTLCWAVLRGGVKHVVIAAIGLGVLLASAFVLSPTFHGRMAQGWEELRSPGPLKSDTSMGVRVVFAKNALTLIGDRPLLGYGLGSFKSVYAQYVDSRYTGYDALHTGDPHNQYLYIAFEHGLLGLILFVAAIATLYRTFPRNAHGVLAACALTAWCLTSFFSSHFRTFPEGHFYALLIAILGAAPVVRVRVSDPG